MEGTRRKAQGTRHKEQERYKVQEPRRQARQDKSEKDFPLVHLFTKD